ncbi:hypothetical protein ACV07N_13270 [Roseivirga echinicomitans]
MSKLYVFGIGGTGSRVLKSLVMLLASGCKLENHNQIVPIIIDPDSGNGDLNKTKEVLDLYQRIRSKIFEPKEFFSEEISTTNNLTSTVKRFEDKDFILKLEKVDQERFKDYIHLTTMDEYERDIVNLLFSGENLNSNLNVGFKGNPNMGSIVLNQFTTSEAFQQFGQSFTQGDSIFIVNSIFGGTGAAGYPLLLKFLRSGNNLRNNREAIKEAIIGAITYLPYFKLKKGEINSGTFLGKAKAALNFYNRTIIENKEVNAQYFIGDQENNTTYENHSGSKEQRNDSHFLELAGALSIFNFDKNIQNTRLSECNVYEYGVENFQHSIDANHLSQLDRDLISTPLYNFSLFSNYCQSGLEKSLGKSRWTIKNMWTGNKGITKEYFESAEFQNEIKKFTDTYILWLKEMGGNKPGFMSEILNQTRQLNVFRKLDVANCYEIEKAHNPSDEHIHTDVIKLFENTTQKISAKL